MLYLLRTMNKIARYDDKPESACEGAGDEAFREVGEEVGVDGEGAGAGHDVALEARCGVVDGDVEALHVFADADISSVTGWREWCRYS